MSHVFKYNLKFCNFLTRLFILIKNNYQLQNMYFFESLSFNTNLLKEMFISNLFLKFATKYIAHAKHPSIWVTEWKFIIKII